MSELREWQDKVCAGAALIKEQDREIKRLRRAIPSNTKQLRGVDGRTGRAKKVKALICSFEHELGGPELISMAQRQLIQRAAFLGLTIEDLEAKSASGETIDQALYVRVCNTQRRLLKTVGLDRSRVV